MEPLPPGMEVEILNQFEGRWSRGFEVAEAVGGAYRVRRRSDGAVLPVLFAGTSVRVDTRTLASA